MKVAVVVGSIRKQSYNLKLAEFLKVRYSDQITFDIVNIRDLPHYDQDIELDPPPVVQAFKGQIAAADAVLWITPEYNYSIPGVLKNALLGIYIKTCVHKGSNLLILWRNNIFQVV